MKRVDFNGHFVEMHKMKLRDANVIFPFVASAMTKIGLGNFDFFRDVNKESMELLQDKLCDNCLLIKGDKKVQLSLSDLEECLQEFIPLLLQFLEYNFGFFSQAPKILQRMLPQLFESSEKT